jgi:hypothetical protein
LFLLLPLTPQSSLSSCPNLKTKRKRLGPQKEMRSKRFRMLETTSGESEGAHRNQSPSSQDTAIDDTSTVHLSNFTYQWSIVVIITSIFPPST